MPSTGESKRRSITAYRKGDNLHLRQFVTVYLIKGEGRGRKVGFFDIVTVAFQNLYRIFQAIPHGSFTFRLTPNQLKSVRIVKDAVCPVTRPSRRLSV